MRGHAGKCLAPCTGEPQAVAQHDALVSQLLQWLTQGAPGWLAAAPSGDLVGGMEVLDPIAKADEVMRSLSRQRRYEDASALREAREDLLSVRRSYAALAEARTLCFAALWPIARSGDGPGVRLNLVWNGRLAEAVTLAPGSVEVQVRELVSSLPPASPNGVPATPQLIAVAQKELDTMLAVRRWYYESDRVSKVPLQTGGAKDDASSWGDRVVA